MSAHEKTLTPEAALEVIERVGQSHAGFRRAHARGLVVRGRFTASADAKRLTRAAHFQGAEVPCLVRFSNAAASPCVADTTSPTSGTVLGLAIKFVLPSGETPSWAGINLPAFVARTPEEFIRFTEASARNAKGKPSLFKLLKHVVTHLHILPGLKAAKALAPAQSFAGETFHGLHTYFFVDAKGVRQPFRYRWVPRTSVQPLDPNGVRARPPLYLLDEMRERFMLGKVVFDLVAQLPDASDELLAANVPWPDTRRTFPLGVLTLDAVHENQKSVEELVFDPGAVVPGIETSDDPILKFRSRIYGVSFDRRSHERREKPAPEDMGQ